MVEAILATSLVAIAASGVLLPFSGGMSIQAEGKGRTIAAKLASDMMEQIVNTQFDEIVSSFDGRSESEGQVKDSSGTVLDDAMYSQFSREVSCDHVYVSQESGTSDAQYILARVEIGYKGREIAVIERLISK